MFRLICFLLLTCLCRAAAPGLEEGRAHWAFQPLSKAAPPVVKNTAWPKNGVDHFILAKLEQNGLQPSPLADAATLIRRVTFDLTGLPPTPEEVEAFIADSSDKAYEALVDKLLASPRYGERWGRHWLDLARYADTSGTHNDLDRPHAWKYRDYVIRSFNDDKPYARFVAEQLAGDEIDGANEETLIATGFGRNGPSNDDNMGKNDAALAQYRADQLDDVISTTSSVFLGLTLGCARCHDHKTDPLLQRDYYSLLAIFNGTEKYGLVPGTQDRSDKRVKIDETPNVHALIETRPQVPATHIMLRGNALTLGDEVSPAVPALFKPLTFPTPAAKTSLRRKTLAEWITSPDNALAWRVMVNRVWQHHFGTGIVASPSNFGFTGAKPTHPELLDWLTRQFVASGGRLKPLHKLMLMSATYRQLGAPLRRMEAEVIRDSILAASGKLNLKLGGPGIKPRIRAELLDASQRNKWPVLKNESAEHWRRSIYIYVKRQLLMPSLELFDAPTTTDSCALRTQSTVPTQSLVLMNDEFVEEQAGHLARRAVAEAGDDRTRIVERLFLITLSKKPSPERLRESLDFLTQREKASDKETALRDLAHVLLNSSEFVYIE